jgi:hypothetical protein
MATIERPRRANPDENCPQPLEYATASDVADVNRYDPPISALCIVSLALAIASLPLGCLLVKLFVSDRVVFPMMIFHARQDYWLTACAIPPLLTLIFGVISVRRAKVRIHSGRGFAWVGIIVSVIWICCALFGVDVFGILG